jgi:signal transduction histidine kinase
VIGRSLLSISNADDQTPFIELAEQVMSSGSSGMQVLHYANPERWFELSMVKLDKETICVTVNDITAQKKSALENEKQKNLLANIMKQSPNGLSITKAIRDEKGEMVDAIAVLMNDACEKLNGVPNEVLLNNTMGSLEPGILTSPLFQAAKALKIGESFRMEYFLQLTNRWLELAVSRMDADLFINVFTDISSTKEAQEKLEQSVSELQRTNSNLQGFAYAASHDLKEPVRKILYFSDRLRSKYEQMLDEEGQKIFSRLESAAGRMNMLIDDLLQFSHINQGAGQMAEVNLGAKVTEVLEDLDLVISEKNAVVEVSSLPVICANSQQMQQLFQNLIGNALKYHKPGVAPHVTLTAEKITGKDIGLPMTTEQQLQTFHLIRVKDNGIGFDQKDAERIFNVFTRLHGNSEYKGTGVGLSIVRKVVENHNGFIRADGKAGAGATFTIYLPEERQPLSDHSPRSTV